VEEHCHGPEGSASSGPCDSSYLHVLVSSRPAQLVHGHDVETLAEHAPLDLDRFAISRQAEGALPPAATGDTVGDASELPEESSSYQANGPMRR